MHELGNCFAEFSVCLCLVGRCSVWVVRAVQLVPLPFEVKVDSGVDELRDCLCFDLGVVVFRRACEEESVEMQQ